MSKLIEALQFYRDGWDATTGDPTDALLADKGDMAMSALESDHAAAIQAAMEALELVADNSRLIGTDIAKAAERALSLLTGQEATK